MDPERGTRLPGVKQVSLTFLLLLRESNNLNLPEILQTVLCWALIHYYDFFRLGAKVLLYSFLLLPGKGITCERRSKGANGHSQKWKIYIFQCERDVHFIVFSIGLI